MTFYGRSFITDNTGAKIQEADRISPDAIVASFDLDKLKEDRSFWGLFRDRRPQLYRSLLTLDGATNHA
jgi:N-carbamoylputrescine amidase